MPGYQTGASTTPNAFLQVISAWLAAQGWTINLDTTVGSGRRLHAEKAGVFVNFRSCHNESAFANTAGAGWGLGMYLSGGYSGASAWNAQPDAPLVNGGSNVVGVGCQLDPSLVDSYHFFDDGQDNIVLVIERPAGIYTHIAWGPRLVKCGYSSDVPYFSGGSPSRFATTNTIASFHGRLDTNGAAPMSQPMGATNLYGNVYLRLPSALWSGSNRWASNGFLGASGSDANQGLTGFDVRSSLFGRLGQSTGITATYREREYPSWLSLRGIMVGATYPRSVLLPGYMWAPDPVTSRFIPLGYAPSVFGNDAVEAGAADAATIVPIGGLDYMLFPAFAVRKAA